ncbi:MAG: aspartate carbamoyltransferase catalytic subunit [Acidobacteriota bacterium]|jgi:aspartate carbamoyltransferase catalytic subunit|nr:aspartate carbamoyltransferase catalytic subunit [Acidobacteriota bacterium]
MASLSHKDLLGIEQLSVEDIQLILDTAEALREVAARPVKKVPTLRGKTVVNLFFEPSTRTRSSFELAEKRLSADILNFSASTSSVTKGETLLDTAHNLEAMSPDIIVIRHQSAGAPHLLGRECRASIVNAGDGMHEHPTQALLDGLTVRTIKGRLDGLKVAIIGDVAHSRVVRSDTILFSRMGADVWVCGPPTLLPWEFEKLGARTTPHMEEAMDGADVIMMLRVQHERQNEAFFPSAREYASLYGLTRERMRSAKKGAIVMHPGPINRGVEIESEVADADYSVILNQVSNGVAARMAVLYLLSGNSGLEP